MEAAGRLAGLTQPMQGVLWPAQGSVPHQGLDRLASCSLLLGLGVLWRDRFVSGCRGGGDESTDRKREGLQAWPES